MGLFGHMRIHDSGIHRNANNTDTPCTPYAPAIHIATATPTTTNNIPQCLVRRHTVSVPASTALTDPAPLHIAWAC
ncbi:unnamed protein product [Schistocephalus solidus]|uniref:Uncharacterized protein n=1 Tax=Schistocephalus solidus TaxID=70667 RepID=A0A183SRJ9_SCHSO|nr:unnamed protein product [Schistocephalus solidus]